MITKKQASKDAVHFAFKLILAEDLRNEIGGKVTAVGLYADNVVVLQLPAEVPEPTEHEPLLVKSLGFLLCLQGPAGKYAASAELESDGARRPFMQSQTIILAPGKSVNMVGVLAPCGVASFGLKQVIVKLGDAILAASFEIRRELGVARPPPTTQVASRVATGIMAPDITKSKSTVSPFTAANQKVAPKKAR